ncbi:MAG: hypothetical protein RLZZ623_2977 [Actinomycetota bacterium]
MRPRSLTCGLLTAGLALLSVGCGSRSSSTNATPTVSVESDNPLRVQDVELLRHMAVDHQVADRATLDVPIMEEGRLVPPTHEPLVSVDDAYSATKSGRQISMFFETNADALVTVLLGEYINGSDGKTKPEPVLVYDFIVSGARCFPSGPLPPDAAKDGSVGCVVHMLVGANDASLVQRTEVWR